MWSDTVGVVATAVRRADVVAGGVAASFGAGLFLGPGQAAALAGGLLPLAALLGVLVGAAAVLSTWNRPLETVPDSLRPFGFALSTTGRLAAAVALAGTVAVYLTPLAALAVVVVAVVLAAVEVPPVVVRVAAVVVVAVLILVVVACLAIAPVAPAVAAPDGASLPGVLGAAAMLAVCMFGATPAGDHGWRWGRFLIVGIVAVLVLAVVVAAVRQTGAARLAISPAPLRAALDAADATAMGTLLLIAVVVGCGFALLAVLRGLPSGGLPHVRVVAAAGVVIAAGMLLIPATAALVGAAVLLLADAAFRVVTGRRR